MSRWPAKEPRGPGARWPPPHWWTCPLPGHGLHRVFTNPDNGREHAICGDLRVYSQEALDRL